MKEQMTLMVMWVISSVMEMLSLTIPKFLGGTMAVANLPRILRKVRYTEPKDGTDPAPILTDVQRNFARLRCAFNALKKDKSAINLNMAMFATSLYSRTVFQTALWKCHMAANSRDSEMTSSCYLVGVPLAWLDGRPMLRSWEVAIAPHTARKLGVKAGTIVQLRRFPETNTIPMTVVVTSAVGNNVLGLTAGSLEASRLGVKDVPTLLGGDCDGDTFVITVYHEAYYSLFRDRPNYEQLKAQMDACLSELENWFSDFWKDIPEYPSQTGKCYTWKDELAPKPRSEFDIFLAKVLQKLSIGSSTNTVLSLFVAKLVKFKDFANVSWQDIRFAGERSTETCMDMKKDEGRDPLCFHHVMCGNRPWDEGVETELSESGFDLPAVLEMMVALKGVSVRKIAKYNKAWAALLGDRTAFEALVAHYQSLKGSTPEGFAQWFVNVLYGFVKNPYIQGKGDIMRFPDTSSSAAATNPAFELRFIELDAEGNEISCTSLGYKGEIHTERVEDERIGVSLVAECDTSCGIVSTEYLIEDDGLVISMANRKVLLRTTVLVPYLFKGREMEVITGEPRLLESWGEVIAALTYYNFKFNLNEVKGSEDPISGEVALVDLVNSALRYLLAAYEVQNGDCYSYSTAAGQTKIVVLDNKIPEISSRKRRELWEENITPAFNNPVALDELRRTIAGGFLKEQGLINSLVDTISGEPGMAFYGKTSEGRTYATEQFVIPQFAPVKRGPVLNAVCNLIEFVGAHPVSFSLPGKPQAPTAEVWAVSLPIDLMDALWVSDALADTFQAKIFKPQLGEYEIHPLEDGMKFQAIEADVKGVGKLKPAATMPWIRLANGQMIRAEVVFQMGSTSHGQLRQTHFRMALEAVARTIFLSTGKRMRVAEGLTPEAICKACVNSGLYADDSLTVEVLAEDKKTVLGRYPAGVLALGMHTQIPSINTSVHGQELFDEEAYGTSTASAGVVSGMMGAMTMRAYELNNCLATLHNTIPPALMAEIGALLECVERRTYVSPEVSTAKREEVDEFAALEAALATKFRR